MAHPKRSPHPPLVPPAHRCPVCLHPQTRIQRLLGDSARSGSTNYVCTRVGECGIAIDLAKVSTWTAV
jgi:hypothetical protein